MGHFLPVEVLRLPRRFLRCRSRRVPLFDFFLQVRGSSPFFLGHFFSGALFCNPLVFSRDMLFSFRFSLSGTFLQGAFEAEFFDPLVPTCYFASLQDVLSLPFVNCFCLSSPLRGPSRSFDDDGDSGPQTSFVPSVSSNCQELGSCPPRFVLRSSFLELFPFLSVLFSWFPFPDEHSLFLQSPSDLAFGRLSSVFCLEFLFFLIPF